ncbi:MAG: 50S ribosomal protein L10 [Holosporaceae bacterium]|nr:50S ribosomal protein L10 [Holosporaceae bacterium]
MKKNEKAEIVSEIRCKLRGKEAVFVVRQNRMTVSDTESLRKLLSAVDSEYVVVKNTLARLAVKETEFECVTDHLRGQTALLFSKNITGSAKVLSEYSSKSDDKLAVVCGGYNGRLLSGADVETLAKLPAINELRATIIAVAQTPAQRLATLLQAPAGQIARVLKAYSGKNKGE